MSVLLLRHTSAGDRDAWEDDDELRPLDKRGRAQAVALRDELRAREHLLERVRHRVHHQRIERLAITSKGVDHHRRRLVDPDGHAELFGERPERLVRRMGDRASETGIGPEKRGAETERVGASQLRE